MRKQLGYERGRKTSTSNGRTLCSSPSSLELQQLPVVSWMPYSHLLVVALVVVNFIPPKSGPPKLIADNCPLFSRGSKRQVAEQLTVNNHIFTIAILPNERTFSFANSDKSPVKMGEVSKLFEIVIGLIDCLFKMLEITMLTFRVKSNGYQYLLHNTNLCSFLFRTSSKLFFFVIYD